MSRVRLFRVAGITKIREHWSDDAERFLVEAHCEVVRSDEPGGEAFSVTVTTPVQLQEELRDESSCELGRGYVFMSDFDERRLIECLQRLVDGSSATSWSDLHAHVERYFDWV